MEKKNIFDINRNDYIEYNNGTSLDRMLNEYYQHLNEGDQLIARSSIADMD